MFERPEWLWLLAAAPIILWPAWLAYGSGRTRLALASAALRMLCSVAVVVALAGARIPLRSGAARTDLVVALDQSRSVAPEQQAWMLHRLAEVRHAMESRDHIALIGFGRDAHLLAAASDPRTLTRTPVTVDSGATDLSGALLMAAGLLGNEGDADKRILLLSDGNETQGDAMGEAPGLAQDHVRVFSEAPPPPSRARMAITSFEAPDTVRAAASFAFRFDVESEAPHAVQAQVRLSADGVEVGGSRMTLTPGMNRLRLPYRVGRPGAYLMKVALAVPAPMVAVNSEAETALSVIGPPRVLIVSGSPVENLVQVLKLRGFDVATAAPHGLPRNPEAYLAYQAVLISDAPAAAFDDDVQQALNHYVADYGGGLIVAGDSLRDSRFHEGALEKALPINFAPQPPPPSREPIAVYLLVDRSNSMSYNSRYAAVRDGERIRYAKQAAAALLNQLDDTDYAGVIAFDSAPFVLGHLRPLGDDRRELLGQVQRLEPGGGTDFKDALTIALQEILASGIAVRQVILLTDGDTNRQYHDHDELMTQFAQRQVPVSTIRIGPDLENLRLLQDFARVTGGVFYRVEDITKLPQLLVHLSHEAQNLKARKHTRIELGAASSVLSGIDPRQVPPMDFFAVTEAKDGAAVPLIAHRGPIGAPLLATWQYALGRSAIFSGDPDSVGSLAWLRWNHYAEFWSQLVSWVARPGDAGPFNLRIRRGAGGAMEIDAEKADQFPITNLFCRVTDARHSTDIALSQVGPSLYHGESVPLARGKYSLALMIKAGDTERVLLRRDLATPGAESADAAELELRPANLPLLRALASATGGVYQPSLRDLLGQRGAIVTVWRPIDGYMPPLAVAFLLGDVLIRRRWLGE